MTIYQVPTPEAEAGLDEHGAQLPAVNDLGQSLAPIVAPAQPAVPQGYNSWSELALAHQNLRALVASKGAVAAAPLATPALLPANTPALVQQLDAAGNPIVVAPATPVAPVVPVAPVPQPGQVTELTRQDMGNLWNEWQANGGSLSPQSYANLQQKHGITPDQVQQFVQGQQAQAQLELSAMHNAAGGRENFEAMAAWALRELPPQEAEGYNRLIANANASGDVAVITTAVQALAAKWQASEGFQQGRALQHPTLAPAGTNAPGASMAGQAYASTEEWRAAMADPKYKTDSAYRAVYMQRTAASQAAGII